MTVAERVVEGTGYAPGWQPLWQPIATAPQDGTRILVAGHHLWPPVFVRWESFSGDWRDENYDPESPTHWMPLPELPK